MVSVYTQEQRAENREKAAPIKQRRLALGLTQKQLAAKAGMSHHTVIAWETGICLPRWDTRQKIRRALGLPEERYYTAEQRNAILADLMEQDIIEWEIRHRIQVLKRIGAASFIDDLRQDCLVCALRAIDRYQPDSTASVVTFTKKNVRYFIQKWILRFRLHGLTASTNSLPRVTVYSLDALIEDAFQLEDKSYSERMSL